MADSAAEWNFEERACAACGAVARREAARFCAACGSQLGEDYFPTDSLRASYSFERRADGEPQSPTREPQAPPRAPQSPLRAAPSAGPRRRVLVRPTGRPRGEFMPLKRENGAAATGLAFVTYALVPYLGILFCPGALLMGGVGLWRARRAPHLGGRRAAALSLLLGLAILCAQLLLWWILYKVPEWAKNF